MVWIPLADFASPPTNWYLGISQYSAQQSPLLRLSTHPLPFHSILHSTIPSSSPVFNVPITGFSIKVKPPQYFLPRSLESSTFPTEPSLFSPPLPSSPYSTCAPIPPLPSHIRVESHRLCLDLFPLVVKHSLLSRERYRVGRPRTGRIGKDR